MSDNILDSELVDTDIFVIFRIGMEVELCWCLLQSDIPIVHRDDLEADCELLWVEIIAQYPRGGS